MTHQAPTTRQLRIAQRYPRSPRVWGRRLQPRDVVVVRGSRIAVRRPPQPHS